MWAFYHASPSYNTERIQSDGLRGHELVPLWVDRAIHQPLGNYLYEREEDAIWYASNIHLHAKAHTSIFTIWRVDITCLTPLWDPEAILLEGEVSRKTALRRWSNPRTYHPRWYIPHHIEPERLSRVIDVDNTVPQQHSSQDLLPTLISRTPMSAQEYPHVLRRYRIHQRADIWEANISSTYSHESRSDTIMTDSHEFSLLDRVTTL